MADTKITALTALTAADPANDVIPIVDVSDTSMAASGTTKKISVNNILGASGTATLASATITGDLTVRTNKLFVNATGVGIGTLSPFADAGYGAIDLRGTTGGEVVFGSTSVREASITADGTNGMILNTVTANPLKFYTQGVERYKIDATGISTWSVAGTTAMTLDSTGLGIGASPIGKFDVYNTVSDTTVFIRSDTTKLGQIVFRDNADAGNQGKLKYDHLTDTLSFSAGGNENLFLTSTGNLGIGVTPSAWGSGLKALQVGATGYGAFFDFNNDVIAMSANLFWTGSAYSRISASSKYALAYYQDIGGSHQWLTSTAAGTNAVAPTMNALMTLDASGNLLVGKTSTAATVGGGVVYLGKLDSARDTGDAATFQHTTLGNTVGSIAITAVATAYNTSSDYRLKESVKLISGGLARVNALKPSIYKWKADGSAGEGFLAHELAEVVPFAVTGDKDAVDANGKPAYQGVDLSKIVPILVAAIQELTAEVNALKNA